MKKLLLTLGMVVIAGLGTASAMYYGSMDSSYYSSAYSSSYSSYSYPYSFGYGIGSYTIGCTTYYYNTRTGAQLYTQNICSNYNYSNYNYAYTTPTCYYSCSNSYSYPTSYSYPVSYSYPMSYSYPVQTSYYNSSVTSPSQYCTYGYYNGSWSPCTSYNVAGNYGSGYGGYQNYLNCYYDAYGQYVCY